MRYPACYLYPPCVWISKKKDRPYIVSRKTKRGGKGGGGGGGVGCTLAPPAHRSPTPAKCLFSFVACNIEVHEKNSIKKRPLPNLTVILYFSAPGVEFPDFFYSLSLLTTPLQQQRLLLSLKNIQRTARNERPETTMLLRGACSEAHTPPNKHGSHDNKKARNTRERRHESSTICARRKAYQYACIHRGYGRALTP